MKKLRRACLLLAVMLAVLSVSAGVPIVMESISLPQELRMIAGQTYQLKTILPFAAALRPAKEAPVVLSGAQTLSDLQTSDGVSVTATDRPGEAQLELSLLGIPVKRMQVRVLPETRLVPGGHSIGVAMNTRGALVVGSREVRDDAGNAKNPAKDAGLMPGDVIEQVNGADIKNAEDLSRLIGEQNGRSVELTVLRGDQRRKLSIQSVKDEIDGVYRLGLWVRDDTAGVGTLTFFDPESGRFGALGHAITDYDTGRRLTVREGQILLSRIYYVKMGKSGRPGELHGNFFPNQDVMGDIEANTDFGLFGNATGKVENQMYPTLPIGTQGTAHVGKATILCTVDGDGIEEYTAEIVSISPQIQPSAKGMVIRITDERLLSVTGGIVQGMSGSPIIQDGRLIGAVTHVFVNDPTQGYGIFIEWMLDVPVDQ